MFLLYLILYLSSVFRLKPLFYGGKMSCDIKETWGENFLDLFFSLPIPLSFNIQLYNIIYLIMLQLVFFQKVFIYTVDRIPKIFLMMTKYSF